MNLVYEPGGRAREYAPLAINLYRGCGHKCLYCYVPAAMRIKPAEFHAGAFPKKDILSKLEADCKALKTTQSVPPIMFSFATDPYNPAELKSPIMPEALRIIKGHGLAVEILTKAGTAALRDIGLLGPEDGMAATLTFIDPAKSRKWEAGAALPNDRIDMLAEAHRAGIRTWISLEPVIEPEETILALKVAAPYVDLIKVGTLNHVKNETDWVKFGERIISILAGIGKPYYLKDDLRKHLKSTGKGWTLEQVEQWQLSTREMPRTATPSPVAAFSAPLPSPDTLFPL